jgi:UDP-N-acetylglucosamine 2-epimerase (non-hydrolysing)
MAMATNMTTVTGEAKLNRVIRRAFDIALAAVSLFALLPVMVLISFAIMVESGRPALFAHTRLGLHGRPIRMLKFRKFYKDCSANGLQLTLEDDTRLTRVGKFLRSTKLDELPQFWNVLVGDMSIIGPRPESTAYADCFKDSVKKVLEHKPGILGPSQIRFRDEGALFSAVGEVDQFYRSVLLPTKARIDLEYYSRRSFWGDVGWLIEGILATLRLKKDASPLQGTETSMPASSRRSSRVAVILGTRPEAIKLMPLLREFARRGLSLNCHVICTSQHTDLLEPLLVDFDLKVDDYLGVLREGKSLDHLLGSLLISLNPLLERISPDVVVVQGDTTSALAGALAGFHRRCEVVHVEAGLRSGNRGSPFPEEVNRRLISTLATLHMAATERNVLALLGEGVSREQIVCVGNTVVDAVRLILAERQPSRDVVALLRKVESRRLIVLTTHRRENFGDTMVGHLAALGKFALERRDVTIVFPIHPNPEVRKACARAFDASDRIWIVPPMIYPDFLHLLNAAHLIVSDSGGIQEEAVTLGKPIIVLRDTTERPEVLESGLGRLAGRDPASLSALLQNWYASSTGPKVRTIIANPFGDGHAASRIADVIENIFAAPSPPLSSASTTGGISGRLPLHFPSSRTMDNRLEPGHGSCHWGVHRANQLCNGDRKGPVGPQRS